MRVCVVRGNNLAIDLGGWHAPLSGSIQFDGGQAETLGLAMGGLYEVAVFHAERQIDGSSFRLSLGGTLPGRSVCVPR